MWETTRATLDHNRRDIVMMLLLSIVAILLFLPMMTRWQVMGDYTTHNQLALDAITNLGEVLRNTPHFLYHITVAGVYNLPFIQDINVAAVWVLLGCFIATLIIIYWQLRQRTSLPPTWIVISVLGLLSVCLSIMMPINFFTPENLYFGYLVPHVYHNPTMIIMKPFAIVIFFMALPLFFNSNPLSRWWILPLAVLTSVSLIAKPSFIIAFVPALGLITFGLMLRRIADVPSILKHPQTIIQAFTFKDKAHADTLPLMLRPSYINWSVLIIGMVIPAISVLISQRITWTSAGGIGIDPLRVLYEWTLHYEDNADQQLVYKFIMSLAFPLLVYGLHITKTHKNLMLNTAWLMFAVSAIFYYLFVDYTVIAAGDFGWSIQIAVLLLYITATIFMLQEYGHNLMGEALSSKQWAIVIVTLLTFALHIVAGIHWYRLHMSQYLEELIYTWW